MRALGTLIVVLGFGGCTLLDSVEGYAGDPIRNDAGHSTPYDSAWPETGSASCDALCTAAVAACPSSVTETACHAACSSDVCADAHASELECFAARCSDECKTKSDALDACLCQATCSAGAQNPASCPVAPSEAECLQFCQSLHAAAPQCREELRAMFRCSAAAPDSDYTCNANGESELLPEACGEERTALQACIS